MKRQSLPFFICLAAVFAIWLAGCGVDTKEHQKVVSELESTRAELQQARTRIADMEQSLIKIPKIDPKLQQKLTAAQEKLKQFSARITDLNSENGQLKGQLTKLQETVGELQRKLESFQKQTGSLPLDVFKKP